jgi:hypothetical protein
MLNALGRRTVETERDPDGAMLGTAKYIHAYSSVNDKNRR